MVVWEVRQTGCSMLTERCLAGELAKAVEAVYSRALLALVEWPAR